MRFLATFGRFPWRTNSYPAPSLEWIQFCIQAKKAFGKATITNVNVSCRKGHTNTDGIVNLFDHFKVTSPLNKIRPSGIRRLLSLAHNTPDAISLGLGEPDFVPPSHVLEAAKQALDGGKTHYTLTTGISELREAFAKKAKREYGLTYNQESEILVTVGGTQAIFLP